MSNDDFYDDLDPVEEDEELLDEVDNEETSDEW